MLLVTQTLWSRPARHRPKERVVCLFDLSRALGHAQPANGEQSQLRDRNMSVPQRFAADDVLLGLGASSKRDLLQTLASEAAKRLDQPEADILGALNKRESLGSTALGRGIALPHARLPGDQRPLMLFARLDRAIDYEARDEEPVDLVILVLWPETEAEGFLPALSDTCRGLRDPQTLRALRTAGSAAEVAQLLNRSGPSATVEPET
jgi:PTS system nitrogen regulatory IIA component